jgi:hypothetical protein
MRVLDRTIAIRVNAKQERLIAAAAEKADRRVADWARLELVAQAEDQLKPARSTVAA